MRVGGESTDQHQDRSSKLFEAKELMHSSLPLI